MLCKISFTYAICIESFCCKLYLTPDRCYTDTARCASLSALHKPLAPQQLEAAQGGEQWETRWKTWPGSAAAIEKFDGRPRWSLFSPFWGWAIGFDNPWRLPYLMHSQLGLDGCYAHIGCPLRQRQPWKCWAVVWRKKYLRYFKLSFGLESGGLNQKLKGSVAVF